MAPGTLALAVSAMALLVACGETAPDLVGPPLDSGLVVEAESTNPDARPDVTAPDSAAGADSERPIDSGLTDAREEDQAGPPDTAPPDAGVGCPGCVLLPPILTPTTETSNNDVSVSASVPMHPGATICFTENGSTPTCNNAGICTGVSMQYDPPAGIPVNGQVAGGSIITVEAIACEAGLAPSSVTTANYTLNAAPPTAANPSPGAVLYPGATPTISTLTDPSAAPSMTEIRYTIAPGAPPTCTAGMVLPVGATAATIGITKTTTIQAITCKTGYLPSGIVNFTYTLTLNPPVFPGAGHNGAPGTYDDLLPSFFFTSDGTTDVGAGATGKDPNLGALDEWICTTVDGTTPGCGLVVSNQGGCAIPADQTVAVGGSGVSAAGTPNAAPFTAPSVDQTGTTIKAIACSDMLAASTVSSAAYTLQLDRPALWNSAAGGPGCQGASADVCIQPKSTPAPPTTFFFIPNADQSTFTAGVQQDIGVNPSGTTPQIYDYACASGTGAASCGGPAGCVVVGAPACTCSAGSLVVPQVGFTSASGASLGPPGTIQVGQAWAIQGCSASGSFASSPITTVSFPSGRGFPGQPIITPSTNGPFVQVLGGPGGGLGGVTITNPSTSSPPATMELCFATDQTLPVCTAGVCVGATTTGVSVSSADFATVTNGAGVGIGFQEQCAPTQLGGHAFACGPPPAGNGVVLTRGGSGYTTPPTVTISSPDNDAGGSAATATSILGSVVPSPVVGIQVTGAGSGYLSAPTVTISGGGGSGAAATAFLANSILLLGQETDPETVTAVMCSAAQSQSTTASQKLDFKLATPDVTSVTSPASPTGNLDMSGTIANGQQIVLSTTSNFVGQSIVANTGSSPTDCSGSNGGVPLALNALGGTVGGCNPADDSQPTLPACNGVILTAGSSAPLASLPAAGSTVVLNAIACSEVSGPTQLASAPRSTSLMVGP